MVYFLNSKKLGLIFLELVQLFGLWEKSHTIILLFLPIHSERKGNNLYIRHLLL
jgi:hypothetical protein